MNTYQKFVRDFNKMNSIVLMKKKLPSLYQKLKNVRDHAKLYKFDHDSCKEVSYSIQNLIGGEEEKDILKSAILPYDPTWISIDSKEDEWAGDIGMACFSMDENLAKNYIESTPRSAWMAMYFISLKDEPEDEPIKIGPGIVMVSPGDPLEEDRKAHSEEPFLSDRIKMISFDSQGKNHHENDRFGMLMRSAIHAMAIVSCARPGIGMIHENKTTIHIHDESGQMMERKLSVINMPENADKDNQSGIHVLNTVRAARRDIERAYSQSLH